MDLFQANFVGNSEMAASGQTPVLLEHGPRILLAGHFIFSKPISQLDDESDFFLRLLLS